MESENQNCAVCFHVIKHPICERCHLKEVAVWMRDREISPYLQKVVFDKVREVLIIDGEYQGYCISCYNEFPSLCSYCFFYKTARILKSIGVSDEDMESFLETFNYRHFNEDYVV